MIAHTPWHPSPPRLPPALLACLTERGSLTEHLIATGHPFGVTVVMQGMAEVAADEAQWLGLPPGSPAYVRHVLLTLSDTPVVAARSVTPPDATFWREVLERGGRSLGFTLFGELDDLERSPLAYCRAGDDHPLIRLARDAAGLHTPLQHLPARRSRFLRDGAPLIVAEAFLPTLERFLLS